MLHDVETRAVLTADRIHALGRIKVGRTPPVRRLMGKGLVVLGLWVAGEPARRHRQVLTRVASN